MIESTTAEKLRIPRVTVLNGHDSEETAILQPDYPASFTLRCQRRVWRERGTTGDAKNRWRAMSRTSNPRKDNEVWHKPKGGNYHELVLFYNNPENHDEADHVKTWTAGYWVSPVEIHRARLMGIVEQMPHADFRTWCRLLRISRTQQTLWQEWNQRREAMIAYLSEHGRVPELTDGHWWDDAPGGRLYLREEDLAVYVGVAREYLREQYTGRSRIRVTVAGWLLSYYPWDRTGAVRKLTDPTDATAAEWKADKRGNAVFPADSRDQVPDEVVAAAQQWLDRGAPGDSEEDAGRHHRSATSDGLVLFYDRVSRAGHVVVNPGEPGQYTVPWTLDEYGDAHGPLLSSGERIAGTVRKWLMAGAPHQPAETTP